MDNIPHHWMHCWKSGLCIGFVRIKLVMLHHLTMYMGVLVYTLVFSECAWSAALIVCLVIANSLSFMQVCVLDPGRVNKKINHRYSPDTIFIGDCASTQINMNKNGEWIRTINIDGEVFEEKYCLECNLFRINGMSHCRECNRCILDMDHHCIWLGNCIGRNNMKHFHVYLYTLVAIIYTKLMLLYKIYKMYLQGDNESKILMAVVLLLFVVYLILFSVILMFTLFHVYASLCTSRSRDIIRYGIRSRSPKIKMACMNLCTIRSDISFAHA